MGTPWRRHTKEILEKAVLDSHSFSDVCRILGIPPATGSQSHLAKMIRKMEIDTSHFSGKQWWKTTPKSDFPAHMKKRDVCVYLVKNSTITSSRLLQKLIAAGLKEYKCERCNNTEWMGQPIPLELHHKDHDHFNNELSNLEVDCPTCHKLFG